jgi:hypothetical protein
VTFWFVVPLTVAVNCWLWPVRILTDSGEIISDIVGFAPVVLAVLPAPRLEADSATLALHPITGKIQQARRRLPAIARHPQAVLADAASTANETIYLPL